MIVILLASQARLTEDFQNDLLRSTHNMVAHWYRYGNTCFKVFFNFHKGCHRCVLINALVANGNVLTVQSKLDLYVQGFYEHLYLTKLENE
jgi:hypothetical protein